MLQLDGAKGIPSTLHRLPKGVLFALCLLLVGGIGLLDYQTGAAAWLLLYLLPVAIAAWFVGMRAGGVTALLVAFAVFGSNLTPSLPLDLWNSLSAGLISWLAAEGLHRLKIAQEMEQQLARTDAATGAINRFFFMELLEAEFSRAERYRFPLTLAHIDLANLKDLNQRLGHQARDEWLYSFIEQLSMTLRANDVVARLGDDEFVVLLPQTDALQAQQVFTRIHPSLKPILDVEGIQLTCFLGVVTFLEMPEQPATLVEQAVHLTQQMKLKGEALLRYAVEPSPEADL